MMIEQYKQILNKCVQERMIKWDIEDFIKTHPSLYSGIIDSMVAVQDDSRWRIKRLEDRLEAFDGSKEKLVKAVENLIQSKDQSSDERVIWAVEEVMDLIQGILP